ncbi:phospholipase A2 inhibitor gamma subunit B-like isoform X2 [Hemicordylus capensis]|uniref:phospholipase A2 inhibitor gamma subunit B-like isoform X2 n=1 Tax=Hemicordylus capensis TaxID=884348 RepID=UPI002302855B|nr:phospholipase A2 inhibitor gamma subunit B-like isoform X2 [Hemicordylus capensis]
MHFLTLFWFNAGMLLFLVRKGVSLYCETCQEYGHTCWGPMWPCTVIHESCGVTLSERTGGRKIVFKRCVSSSKCGTGLTRVNFGSKGIIATVLTCCSGEECKNPPTSMPPMNTTLNGRKCTACYGVHSRHCKREVVQCAGDEIYCLKMTGVAALGREIIEVFIMGCANKGICDDFEKGLISLAGVDILGRGSCVLNSKVASGMDCTTSGLFRRFLPFLAVFLSTKMAS